MFFLWARAKNWVYADRQLFHVSHLQTKRNLGKKSQLLKNTKKMRIRTGSTKILILKIDAIVWTLLLVTAWEMT